MNGSDFFGKSFVMYDKYFAFIVVSAVIAGLIVIWIKAERNKKSGQENKPKTLAWLFIRVAVVCGLATFVFGSLMIMGFDSQVPFTRVQTVTAEIKNNADGTPKIVTYGHKTLVYTENATFQNAPVFTKYMRTNPKTYKSSGTFVVKEPFQISNDDDNFKTINSDNSRIVIKTLIPEFRGVSKFVQTYIGTGVDNMKQSVTVYVSEKGASK